MESAAQKRQEEKMKIELREKDLAAKFAKLALWKKELKNKTAKKMAEAEAAKVSFVYFYSRSPTHCNCFDSPFIHIFQLNAIK